MKGVCVQNMSDSISATCIDLPYPLQLAKDFVYWSSVLSHKYPFYIPRHSLCTINLSFILFGKTGSPSHLK